MKPLVHALFFLFLTLNAQAQDKNITLIIDSLQNKSDSIYLSLVEIRNEKSRMLQELYVRHVSNFGPDIVCELQIPSNDNVLRIRIDKKGGYLQLNNVYKLDTVRISKYFVLENCLCDSVSEIYSEKELNTDKSKYQYSKQKLHKKCKNTYSATYTITINGKQFSIPLSIVEEQGLVCVSSGLKPKQYRKNPNTYKGRKKIRFWNQKTELYYIYVGEIYF
jgi:hypothetical protein